MKINAAWHEEHRMPTRPTLEQRVGWHLEHSRRCGCRRPSGAVLEEMKRRYLGTHQEFWVFFGREDQVKLAVWAKACAERVLSYFEKVYPEDKRPREALRVLGEWIETGEFRMPVIRGASLGAHAAVRGVEGNASAVAAAHAAGQAVASAHVVTHALGAALYAQKAVAAANPEDAKTAVEAEKSWQLAQLSGRLQAWVGEQLSIIQRKSSLFRPIV